LLDLIYALALVLGSPWLVYRLVKTRDFGSLPRRFGLGLGPPLVESIWLHGSSVGEVSLLKPLVRLLEAERPGLPLVISSHTATGVTAARLAYPEHRVLRFPFDFSFAHRAVLESIRPLAVVIVESDLWPNHLLAAERRGIAVAVVNAKLSEKSLRWHRWSRLVPRGLREVAIIAAQTEEHAARFEALGVARERIRVTGNMKYDLTAESGGDAGRAAVRRGLGVAADELVVIGGSLHPREDLDLLAAYAALVNAGRRAKLVIVPRYPEQSESMIEHAERAGFAAIAKTALDRGGQGLPDGTVLVVDTLGELNRFYAAADVAFVGGSLYYRGANKGGHNLMEPAILGLPVLFGPFNFSFKETVADLLDADAGVLVRTREELGQALARLVDSPTERAAMGLRARRVVLDGRGASARNLALLLPAIDAARSCRANS
jgi:3-deoxy-D-manno-octulosonic-acid transferase